MNEIASLIYWNSNVTKEDIEKVIEKLKKQGMIDNADTREYNYDHGTPIWYIP
jgi:transcription initiation factor IIE alpha subunit